MKREIKWYEKAGKSYIGFDASGRPVGLITDVRSINTPERRIKRSNDLTDRLAR